MGTPPLKRKEENWQRNLKGGSCERLFTKPVPPLQGQGTRVGQLSGLYQPPRSPTTTLKSASTFGTTESLQSKDTKLIEDRLGLVRSSSFISRPVSIAPRSEDAESIYRPAPAFGRSRRMSRSLPELRDCQFVSVLPDLEEEESEESEFEKEEIVYQKPTKVPWFKKLDFIFCSVCQAFGLSNFWRFPYYCYSNGGGSFLLAYVVLLITCGIPLLCMEFATGQVTQSGPISALGQLCPLMKGVGIASVMLSFWLTAYYSVLISWTLFYMFNSFYSPPRWTRCTNTWNKPDCREQYPGILGTTPGLSSVPEAPSNESFGNPDNASVNIYLSTTPATGTVVLEDNLAELYGNVSHTKSYPFYLEENFTHPAVEFIQTKMLETSHGIEESGELRFELLASVLFVWVMIYIALRKTDFFRGKTIYVLTVASHLLLFCIFLRTIALEGAKTGLHYLFQPEWDRMTNPRVWLYALAQAFHSLGVVLGPSILMGSCNKQHNNLLRDTIVLAVATILTVLVIACVTFATLGHLALKLNKPVQDVLHDDPGTVFIIYSVVIGSMPLPSCWGVLFFLIFMCLGLDSLIKLMATLVAALKEAYTYYIKRRFQGHSLFLAVICGFCFFATIPYLTQASIYFFQLMDHFIAVIGVLVVALLEICTLSWLYGANNLSICIQQMTGKSPSYFYKFCWIFLSPLIIMAILIYSCIKASQITIREGYDYPTWAYVMGCVALVFTLCWVPFLAVAAYRKAPKSHIFNRLGTTIQPQIRGHADSIWDPKPVIIFDGSTITDAEFPDYKIPELPSSANSMHTPVMDRHFTFDRRNVETTF